MFYAIIYMHHILSVYRKEVCFMASKKSVPEYTRKAIQNYQSKFDRVVISLPLGSKEIIKDNTDKSMNQFFNDLFQKWKTENSIE